MFRCYICGVKCTKKCSKCKAYFFCSNKCIKKGWKEHKNICGNLLKSNLNYTYILRYLHKLYLKFIDSEKGGVFNTIYKLMINTSCIKDVVYLLEGFEKDDKIYNNEDYKGLLNRFQLYQKNYYQNS